MMLQAALGRQRVILGGALVLVTVLAWIYLWQGAGMGMSALDMTTASLFPHRLAPVAGDMDLSWILCAAMWWVMMVAMMTPSAAPLILLYAAVLRRQSPADHAPVARLSIVLLAAYLGVWLVFSAGAATVQVLLQPTGLLSDMMLWSRSAWFSATLLAAAGAYQFSPLKRACLSYCRGPADFLARHGRAGWRGAIALGIRHGTYCVGCCWMLMLLLFVGGVMNLLWIAVLTVLVLLEKLAPRGEWVSRTGGVLLLAWALVTLQV